LKYLRYIKIKV